MKFAVQVRVDHASKPGGDTALAKAFAARILRAGHEAELVTDSVALRQMKPDVLLAFNLDQPLELLGLCRDARMLGCLVAVYALHHPDSGVGAYLASQLRGWRGVVARLVQARPSSYFYVMSILRGVLRRNPRALYYLLKGRRGLLADTAELVDQLLVSGPSEAEEIHKGMPELTRIPTWNVPHPIDLPSLPDLTGAVPSSLSQGRRFFTAGRIESRKNQLSVLTVAERFPNDEFVFAGLVNETDRGYAEAFQGILAQRPNCRWVGQLDMAGLLQSIARADAVLSPSWFEVMSLINLFAYAVDTPVISACHTYDADMLGDSVLRYHPERAGDLARVLAEFPSKPRITLSWKERSARSAGFTALTWEGFDRWLSHVDTKKGAHA